MAAHLRPRESTTRPVRALVLAATTAVGVLLVLTALDGASDDAPTRLVRPATAPSAAPTVLGNVVESTTSRPDASSASSASSATVVVPDAPPADPAGPSGGQTSPMLAPPVSIISPAPPRTTTTRPTTTSSTSTTVPTSTTTTDSTSTTTEAPPIDG